MLVPTQVHSRLMSELSPSHQRKTRVLILNYITFYEEDGYVLFLRKSSISSQWEMHSRVLLKSKFLTQKYLQMHTIIILTIWASWTQYCLLTVIQLTVRITYLTDDFVPNTPLLWMCGELNKSIQNNWMSFTSHSVSYTGPHDVLHIYLYHYNIIICKKKSCLYRG